MFVVFFVIIFMFVKLIFGVDEDIKLLVMEGCFKIKCEKMVSFMFNV